MADIGTPRSSNARTLGALVMIVAGMGGLAYASVPLYRLFCQATGFGGTTQRAAVAPAGTVERVITVRFDANIDNQLPWTFQPDQRSVTVKVGENGLAFYRAHNQAGTAVAGNATYNVTPAKAGLYFSKIECFCFTEQVLQPGETVEMPVSFFIDPAIVEDRNLDDVHTITLSYSFFRAKSQDPKPVAAASQAAAPAPTRR